VPKRPKTLISIGRQNGSIDRAIRIIRGERVLLDADLAALYAVSTRALIQATKRNASRFPADFMFQLASEEVDALRSQNVISTGATGRGGRRYRPYAFTEHGVAMLSSVLRSPRAIRVNIEIMRAFVRLRRVAAAHADLAARLDDLEDRYDERFRAVFQAIRKLMTPPVRACRRIGFRVGKAVR
jgi:hypothetical protein